MWVEAQVRRPRPQAHLVLVTTQMPCSPCTIYQRLARESLLVPELGAQPMHSSEALKQTTKCVFAQQILATRGYRRIPACLAGIWELLKARLQVQEIKIHPGGLRWLLYLIQGDMFPNGCSLACLPHHRRWWMLWEPWDT